MRKQAEEQGTRYMERPLHIGSMHVRLWDGAYIFEDLTIEGFAPDRTPFFTAKRIVVSMPWSTLFNRRIVFDTIELNDWQMHVESLRNGTVSFPKLMPKGPRGQSAWTTTLQYVHAGRGSSPTRTTARRGESSRVTSTSRSPVPAIEYVGQARFSDGLTAIQGYVPFRTDMSIDVQDRERPRALRSHQPQDRGHRVRSQRRRQPVVVARADAADEVDHRPAEDAGALLRRRDVQAHVARVSSPARFIMFKEPMPNGTTRTGRELKGTFVSTTAGVNDFRFSDLTGGGPLDA